jgi:transcriptional regulator with GAF, ATPase, and Fis domain
MQTVLSIYDKEHTLQKTEDITLLKVVSIGRHRFNNIQLPDPKITRFHAALFYEDEGKYFLQDLGSQNGLLINGEKRDCGPIIEGDKIEIGDFILVLQKQAKKLKSKEHKVAISSDDSDTTSKTVFSPVAVQTRTLPLDAERLLVLYRISHLANSSLDIEESLQSILDELYQVFKPDRVFVALLENNGAGIKCLAKTPREDIEVKISRTMLDYLLENKQTLVTDDALADEKFKLHGRTAKSVLQMKLKSVVCVPLKWEGQIRGILYMDSFKDKRLYEDNDLHFFTLIGDEVSVLMERNMLYKSINDGKTVLEKIISAREIVIGNTPVIKGILNKTAKIAKTDVTVLITGETGTGKGNIAKLLHRSSNRRDKPFVEINCSAIPETLFESELFGHKKGAFTGAEERIGKIVYANSGTLFLDEIGDLSLAHQAKLLKVIEEKNVCPVGTNISVSVDVRIIAATNKNLEKEIRDGKFRQDLYARFTIPLHLPPLRERKEDIPLLAGYFLKSLRPEHNPAIKKLSNKSVDLLLNHDWPNNIRELHSSIIRALVEAPERQSILSPDLLQIGVRKEQLKQLEEIEKEYIIKVLRHTNCNKEKAARILGISKQTLFNKWHAYNLNAILKEDEFESNN